MPHYAFDAAALLEQCLEQLQDVIQADEKSRGSHWPLYDLKEALIATEQLLYEYFQCLLEQERVSSSSPKVLALFVKNPPSSLQSSIGLLKTVLMRKQDTAALSSDKKIHRNRKDAERVGQSFCQNYYSGKSSKDSLLFRLIVALQLCLVRLDDARFVITGRRLKDGEGKVNTRALSLSLAITGCVGAVSVAALAWRRHKLDKELGSTVVTSTKVAAGSLMAVWLRQKWNSLWMSTKIVNSTNSLESWNRQWHILQTTPAFRKQKSSSRTSTSADTTMEAEKSRKLVEYALQDTPKSSFWHSQGELRFLMLKRAMDVFYASVGTAVKVTGNHSESDAVNWQITLATAAAASFYSLTGASGRAAEAISSSESARHLIQNAWGMVSLPSVKNLSLQASKILKGAAVADRIEICGVSCFVLSREPAPELAAAIKRFHRKHGRHKSPVSTLSTIDEDSEHYTTMSHNGKPFARSCGRYRQRDVLFHLTGGGFFAHIIASDLLYLIDWSALTGAVVICPEYALLPNHTFPDALHEVEDVYRALLCDSAVHTLGFEVNRIVVTGESAGGNLAAALCVKLCMQAEGMPTSLSIGIVDSEDSEEKSEHKIDDVVIVDSDEEDHIVQSTSMEPERTDLLRMPDALMLSCAALNLSLEVSHSRLVGTHDPVLPSGLLSVISDAYLPSQLGISKKDPLVSPIFAADSILSRFPPTLLFASSNDPLLDDSVLFNKKLRSLGVESDLRAAQNLPHAYLGLGTAGFPEAQQVQEECVEWLAHQLTRDFASSQQAS